VLFQTDIQHAQFTSDGSVSRLTYIAKTDLDYGTMTCLASNEVGESNKACVFQIVRDGNSFRYPLPAVMIIRGYDYPRLTFMT
jgi:hypothetical protein